MNEKIKELAEQAVTRFDQDMDGSMEPEELGRWVRYGDLAKFAELIIEECAFQCQHLGDMERIGKHFEVDVFKQFGV